jgi:hypothetical protein
MMTEQQKTAIYKWRQSHQAEYCEYVKTYYKEYHEKNRDKEVMRHRKRRQYLNEAQRMRNILISI